MPSPSCERTAPSPAIAVTGRAGVCCGKCLSCCRQDILLFVTLYHTSLRTLPGVVFVMSDLTNSLPVLHLQAQDSLGVCYICTHCKASYMWK